MKTLAASSAERLSARAGAGGNRTSATENAAAVGVTLMPNTMQCVMQMGDVTGPISTLRGAHHLVPKGAKCDVHPRRKAIANVQGETDSFGCETHYCCQECLDEIRDYERSAEAQTGCCEWCKQSATDLRDRRDPEEGFYGRVYRVCGACRARADEEARAEMDYWEDYE